MIKEVLMNTKIVSYMLLIAVIGAFLIPYVLAVFYEGYKHSTMVMISLGESQ